MREYTVVALTSEAGDFYVAAVLLGRQAALDVEAQSGEFFRYGTFVTAAGPEQAERVAYTQFREDQGGEGW